MESLSKLFHRKREDMSLSQMLGLEWTSTLYHANLRVVATLASNGPVSLLHLYHTRVKTFVIIMLSLSPVVLALKRLTSKTYQDRDQRLIHKQQFVNSPYDC